MRLEKLFALGCVASLLSGSALAAPPTTPEEAIDAITADSVLLSGWISDQLKVAVPFNSTSGNVMPTQLKMLGFEFGVEAVVSGTKADIDGLRNLGTSVVDTGLIDVQDRFPMPAIIGHAKIGLPWGLDTGVRFGGIPSYSHDEGTTHTSIGNTIFGVDVRKNLIEEGITRPFGLTLGANFTHAKGHLDATTPYDPTIPSDVVLSNAEGSTRSQWDTTSFGLQAVLNKKITIFNPYVGASANMNFGSVSTSITNTGTITSVAGTPTSTTLDTVGTASRDVEDTDLRALVGLEITVLPFLKLGLHGEFANHNNMAAAFGLRFEFR